MTSMELLPSIITFFISIVVSFFIARKIGKHSVFIYPSLGISIIIMSVAFWYYYPNVFILEYSALMALGELIGALLGLWSLHKP